MKGNINKKDIDLSKITFDKFLEDEGLQNRERDYLYVDDYDNTLDTQEFKLHIIEENTDNTYIDKDKYWYLDLDDSLFEYEEDEDTIAKTLYSLIDIRIKFLKHVEYRKYINLGVIDEEYFDEIKSFLKFYIVAKTKKNELGNSNLKQMAIDIFDKERFEDDISDDDMENISEWIGEDQNFKMFYDKVCRDLSNSTQDKEILKLAGIRNNKVKHYKGRKISRKCKLELKSLTKMWEYETKLTHDANKAHKKIKSNMLEKMTDKNYKNIYEYLNNEIINSNEEYKNIYFYSLELKLANELRKCTLKNLNKIKDIENQVKFISYTIAYIHIVPVLTIREKLSDKLFNILSTNEGKDIEKFTKEVSLIMRIINIECLELLNIVSKNNYYKNFSEKELEEFKSIYNINNGRKSFENKYKIKVDYNIDDVRKYGEVIKAINIESKKKIV
ncbi:hypothetical protein QQO45_13650, partial [Clostridioides difficile]